MLLPGDTDAREHVYCFACGAGLILRSVIQATLVIQATSRKESTRALEEVRVEDTEVKVL